MEILIALVFFVLPLAVLSAGAAWFVHRLFAICRTGMGRPITVSLKAEIVKGRLVSMVASR